MSQIPTAEEFIEQMRQTIEFRADSNRFPTLNSWIAHFAIEYAKLHVQAALEAAAEEVNWTSVKGHEELPEGTEDFIYVVDHNGPDYQYFIDKSTILEAYPPENIK